MTQTFARHLIQMWRDARAIERIGSVIGLLITILLLLIVGLFWLPRSSMDDLLPIFVGWGYLTFAIWVISVLSTLITLIGWRASGLRFKLEFIGFLATSSAAAFGLAVLIPALSFLAEAGSFRDLLERFYRAH